MKSIPNGVGVAIVVVAVLAILALGYKFFLAGPPQLTPEDTKAMMQKGMKEQAENAYKKYKK